MMKKHGAVRVVTDHPIKPGELVSLSVTQVPRFRWLPFLGKRRLVRATPAQANRNPADIAIGVALNANTVLLSGEITGIAPDNPIYFHGKQDTDE